MKTWIEIAFEDLEKSARFTRLLISGEGSVIDRIHNEDHAHFWAAEAEHDLARWAAGYSGVEALCAGKRP